jgi:Flp pilus assembly protein TadG
MTLYKALLCRLSRALLDWRGTSAIEFGLVSPMLVVAVVGLADLSNMAYGYANMQAAVRAGIHYSMSGGTDADAAKTIADSAWSRKPQGGTLNTSRTCKCATVNWDCSLFCPDATRPEMYMTVTANGTFGGNFYSMNKTITETVRLR